MTGAKLRGVRFVVTLATADGEQDVAVTAPSGSGEPEIRAALRPVCAACGLELPDTSELRHGALLGAPEPAAETSAGLALDVAGGPRAGRTVPLSAGDHCIGRDPTCDVAIDDPRISRRHAVLSVGRDRTTVHDLSSVNGVEIDNESAVTHATLPVGSLLRVGDTLLRLRHVGDEPRGNDRTPAPTIEVPSRIRGRGRWPALLALLLPVAGAVLLAWLTGEPQLLLFALLGPLTMLPTTLASNGAGGAPRAPRRRKVRRRDAAAAGRAISAALTAELHARHGDAPGPPTVERIARPPNDRLWQHSAAGGVVVRLGTARCESSARTRDRTGDGPAGVLENAPLVLGLVPGVLGVVGPPALVTGSARWLLGQLAVRYPPRELALVLLTDDRDEEWRWARWLPQFAARFPISVTGVAGCRSEVRVAHAAARHVVLVLTNGATARHMPGVTDVVSAPGVSTLWLDDGRGTLPACRTVMRLADPWGSRATLHTAPDQPHAHAADVEFVADLVGIGWAQRVARSLAPLRDTAADAAGDGLLALLGWSRADAATISARWRRSDGAAGTLVGRGRDGPVRIDLVTDGPHALIAGTTGSGKSVLLRTLVAGLALTYPPDEITFLLVDYKGGAAFAACADLPHTVGVVTDLDAHLTGRALRSLAAEIERRERLLASVGAEHLDALRRTTTAHPPPRLVIVVDEFATLAEELPDFVPGLIGVAQRGRSLGVHLVLATQRPGRSVSPEIRANTSLRISLRAVTAADSHDVIDSPDAAALPATEPGHALLRTGAGLVAFRVADVDTAPAAGIRVEPLGPWHQPAGAAATPTGCLDAVVAAIRTAAINSERPAPAPPWLPPLPDRMELELDENRGGRLSLGLVDLPDRCRQPDLGLELSGHTTVVVCGDTGAGTSTALRTVALRAAAGLPPGECEIYAAGWDAPGVALLRTVPHTATALSRGDDDLVEPLLDLLATTSGDAHRLLLLDDWDAVLRDADETYGNRLHDQLARLAREARSLRLTIVVGGGRALLRSRFAPAADERWVLRLADRGDYALAGIAPAVVPVRLPPGRGVRAGDGAEIQFGCFADPAATAAAIARRWRGMRGSSTAVRLRALPAAVTLADCGPPTDLVRLGLGGWEARPVGVDLARSGHLLVAGPPRSGRTTTLELLLAECRRLGRATVVAAPKRSPLHRRAERLGTPVVTPDHDTAEALPDRAVLLVDDVEHFADTACADTLTSWARDADVSVVVAGRADELATAFRGLAVTARRNRRGILLQPRPLDGELLGIRLDRGRSSPRLPGRGVLVGLPVVGATGDAVPVQLATPDQPPDMWG